MKKSKDRVQRPETEKINAAEMVAAYDELDQLREQYPDIASEVNPQYNKKTVMERLLGFYTAMRERFHKETVVQRKVYLWLHLLGMFGVHHFYARHWVKGLIYLAVCWSGISIGMTLIDWMAAFPKAADENGRIVV